MNLSEIIPLAEQKILNHPESFVIKMQYGAQTYWIKRRPFSKKNFWHRLQRIVAGLIGLSVFYPTVSGGGSASLLCEADKLRQFKEKDILVPKVLTVTEKFMITEDVGCQLNQYLGTIKDETELQRLLHKAVRTLALVHSRGLCHARPSLKDMTLKNDCIYLIDLEENPLHVMSLDQAQARDIWLFLLSAARYCRDESWIADMFQTYSEMISQDITNVLVTLTAKLAPLLNRIEYIYRPFFGKDIYHAIMVNRVLGKYFEEVILTPDSIDS